jgi:hypothetical protein
VQAGSGAALIVLGGGLGLLVVFGLWHRLSALSALLLVGALGMLIGAGALLLQEDPGPADWIVTLGVLGIFTPVHCRWVFGPPGPPRRLERA